MAKLEGIVCLNHPNVQAVARCTTCMKPICGECVIVVNNEKFCSEECVENHIRTSAEISRFKEKQKSGGIKKMIFLLIVAALAYFAWTKKDEILKFFDEQKKVLKN